MLIFYIVDWVLESGHQFSRRGSMITRWAGVSGFQANCGLWVSLPEGPFIVCVWREKLDAIQESRRETIPSIDPKESPAHHLSLIHI